MKQALYLTLFAGLCIATSLHCGEAQKTTFKAAVNSKNAPLAIAVWNVLDETERASLAGFKAKFEELGGETAARASQVFMEKVANAKTQADQKAALAFLFEETNQPGTKVASKLGLGNTVAKTIRGG